MSNNFTFNIKVRKTSMVYTLLLFVLSLSVNGQVTKTYADQVVSESHVTNSANATAEAGAATLEASSGFLLGAGAYSGHLELKFSQPLSAGTTSYLHLDFEDDILNALLGGELGGALADILGTVLLGNHYFNVEARGVLPTNVLQASSQNGFSSDEMRLVIDEHGNYLLAITPNFAYDKIYVENKMPSLIGLGVKETMDVYGVYYTTGQRMCGEPFATSYSGSGGTIDVLDLGQNGVQNPAHAIDADPNTYSNLRLGLLSVAGSLSQTIYFDSPSQATDQAVVELQVDDPTLLSLNVADGIKIEAFLGSTLVATFDDWSLLDLDLLGLLSNSQRVKVPFAPGTSFDRVRVTISSLVELQLTKSVKVYGAYQVPATATLSVSEYHVCEGETASLTATSTLGNLRWYSDLTSDTPLFEGAADFVTPALIQDATYYVASAKAGCVTESARKPVNVFVHPQAVAPTVVEAVKYVNSGGSTVFEIQNPQNHIEYVWYDGANAVHTGTTFMVGNVTSNQSYEVKAKIGATCVSASKTTVSVNVTAALLPPEVSPTTITITEGENASFVATATPNSSVNFIWEDQNGDTLVVENAATGQMTFETGSSLTPGTYTYEVYTQSATETSTSVFVTITVVSANALDCYVANTQTSGVLPVCVLCEVDEAQNAVDGDINTASRFVAPASVIGGVWQELVFQQQGQSGDKVELIIGEENAVLNLTLLGGITFETYNGGTANGDAVTGNALVDVTLLSGGTKAKVVITAGGVFDRVRVTYRPLLGLLNNNFLLYKGNIDYQDPAIVTQNVSVCEGDTTTLTVTPASGYQAHWYAQEVGGTPLISNSVSYTTPALTTLGENTFYVALLYNGCEEANRLPVSVMVNKVPNAVDLRAEVEPVYCTGETVGIVPGLALGSSLNANDVTYDWYFDINKTQPISSGIVGGVDYFIDNLGMLAVNGLPASATPYTYYLSATNKNNCESEAGDLLEVSFKVLNTVPQVTVTGAGNPVCEGELVTLEASVAGINIDNPVYSWHQDINLADTPVLGDSIVVNANTTNTEYYVYVTGDNICPSAVESVSLTVNAVPEITLTKTSEIVALGNTIDLPAVTTIPNGLTPVWYDESGQVLPTTTGLSFSQTGVYTYVVAVEDAVTGCIATKEFTITVYDATACPTLTERVYADKQRWVTTLLGGVSNKNNAIDGNPKTYSTITTGLVLLGLGTTYQDLSWSNQTIAAGTPVSIKLGPEVGVLGLLNGISVVGRKNGQNIGAIKIVDMDLLNLINGENSYEYTFVPSNSSGPQDYDEVRIMVGGVLGIGNSVNVYGAYYRTPAGQVLDCQQGQVEDVFAGVDQVAALGALTGLTGVENPWDAVDNDMNTYAVMYNGVGVAAITQLTVDFKSASLEGDKIHIYLSNPNNILNLGLLSGFSIQRYLGTTKVGAPLDTAGGLLSLELLGLGSSTAKRLVVDPGDDLPYDRIRISNGGVVDVLDIIRIFEIKREPKISIQNGIENKLAICATDNIRISLQDDCTTYEVRDENDNLLTKLSEDTFELPSHVQENTTYTYKIQAYRYGCEYGSPQEIEVSITASALQTDLEPIQVNGANISGPLCLDQNESVVLTTALSDSSTITNPVYYWYDETGDSVVSADSSVLNLGVLTNGTYTYSVGVSGDGVCESTEANRREITFEIQVAATASDITVQDQAICYTDDAVITPTVSGIVNPQFNWYLANDTSQPILDGDTAGQVTYHISANGTLTVEGLSAGVTTSYYVSVQGDNFCENLPGTLAKATVVVSDVASPTATETTQTFCASDVPSIADIVVNESNVVWYDAASNGNQLGDTVLLADNTTYYASLTTAAGCESTSRLAITVSLTDPGLPTATETTQTFCASDAPSIADIVVNESNVIWYDGATNGTQLGDTTLLTDAATYYASLTTAAGCESTSRLAITVSLTDPGLPTATETTQTFCASDAPSIADIVVNENNVVWYDAASNGVQLGDTMLLADNTTYYASLTTAAGCESTSRLAITVSLTDPGLPTATETTQTFCASDMPSIADISVNESNVVWYDAASNGVQLGDTTLLADATTYYASLTTAVGCESTSRLAITVSLTDPGLPTATETTQTFCASDMPSIADISVNESNVVWYDAATNGVQLSDTTLLTDATTYYASLTTAAGCESTSRLAITVSLTDPGLPTATETTQTFCASDAPSIADIVVNENNVVWYDAASNGVQLGDTMLLADNTTYYASLTTAAGCESTSRLAITVSLTDPGLPTATETTQTFCASDMPSIADISVNESNVVWYDAATNGVQLGDTVLLTDATTYYASLTTAAGCESTSRLAITVSLTDPGLPTATETTQTFCASDAPSIADIVVNESNVVWYDAATNGVQLGDSTLLSDNTTYYASLTTAEGCESTSRLAITVSLTDPGLPTATETTQTFCASDMPSIADISVNESNVVWYDAATNGVQLSDTTLLTDATTYYASLTTAAGCESTSRLAITVSLTDPGLPTATETTQTFCAS
ncbi:immunoglobulin domain-containing protein, partial [Mesonia hippocampi]|uniref:immunoglobulin domain-containing protein n=1 Tax=Mesonia hippocampi TaxID=1628250 RepID=UPI003F956CFC